MQATIKGEAEAWLEGSSRYAQSRAESSPKKNNHLEDAEERSEHEEVSEPEEEDSQEENDEEYDEEEDEQEDIEEEEEGEDHSDAEDEHGAEKKGGDNRENASAKKDKSPHKTSPRLPQGSPVKRAHTMGGDHRKHARGMISQREKSANDGGKYMSERAMFEKLTGKSLSPTRHPDEFKLHYNKFCKEFLHRREEELEKKRRQKQEEELAKLQHKPTLISRPQTKPYIPLLERTPLLDARREQELQKIKKEQEEKLEKEFEAFTFAPKINPRSKNLATSPTRERIMNIYMRSRAQFSHSPLPQRKVDRDAFQPKINPNSRNIMAMKEEASIDVVDRLYQRADLGRTKKTELAKKLTPKFTPSLNKNTRKIAKQIEENYNNGCNTDRPQTETTRRVDKRKRSEIESNGANQEAHREDEGHLEQASDFELLEILKQFNSMLEQKNESPINLQQLSTLMQTYSGKKASPTEYPHREDTEEQEGEYEEEGVEEEEEDDGEQSSKRANIEHPMRSYPPGAGDDATSSMANIEKNLMHLQGSLQDLKGNDHRAELLYANARNSEAYDEERLQSSSHSPNKKVDGSQSSRTKKTKQDKRLKSKNSDEYSEEIPSKSSVGANGTSEKSVTKKSGSEKSQKSSQHTPSKSDISNQMETKAPASVSKSVKKEDFSSPTVLTGNKKKSQTTTKKTKKVKTYTDQTSKLDQEQSQPTKEAKSLNEVFSHTVGSKNSLEAFNSNFEVQDYIEETSIPMRKQPEERVKGHAKEQSFGGYPRDNFQTAGQGEDIDRSNQTQERPKSKRKDPKTQSNVSSKNKISDRKSTNQDRTPEKSLRNVDQEEEKLSHKSYSANVGDQKRRSIIHDDKKSKPGSVYSQQLVDQQEEGVKSKSRRGSRKVSFDMPPSESRKSSIYETERRAIEQVKGNPPTQRKSIQEQHHEKSVFASKNRRPEDEHKTSDDDLASSNRGQKPNIGDYMSFSANTLDQHTSFDEHQAPQDEKKLLEGFESEASKTSSTKQVEYLQTSPSRYRAQFEVVTTETIQIEPQSAPRFAYAMDGTDKTIPTASSRGLKAMAEQIVKKFKAYDAQIKQTAREYKLSVSPPRTSSPSPDHYENGAQSSGAKKEQKVFKSVEKSGLSKPSKNDKMSRTSRNSITGGSITSVQSGDRRLSKK